MSARVMAHMVAGYPDFDSSVAVGRALLDAGAAYLEVQFPFSDPTADGPVIQTACTAALDAGFRVADGFRLVRELCSPGAAPVFIMSYASLVVARGVDSFVRESVDAGAAGLIVPDLPVDSDEGLYGKGKAAGLEIVPVVVPGMSERRLRLLDNVAPNYVYAALRSGITGSYTEIGAANLEFLERVASTGARVLAGFGIRSSEQVAMLSPHVHAVVVGSAFVAEIAAAIGSITAAGTNAAAGAARAAANGRGEAAAAAVGRRAAELIDG